VGWGGWGLRALPTPASVQDDPSKTTLKSLFLHFYNNGGGAKSYLKCKYLLESAAILEAVLLHIRLKLVLGSEFEDLVSERVRRVR